MLALIKKLEQKSNTSFRIVWSDDRHSEFDLAFLQRNCPCARCQDSKKEVQEGLRATKISSVGNYALRIDFTAGCTRGVFTFNFLRRLYLNE